MKWPSPATILNFRVSHRQNPIYLCGGNKNDDVFNKFRDLKNNEIKSIIVTNFIHGTTERPFVHKIEILREAEKKEKVTFK